jgi:hypothetical protein
VKADFLAAISTSCGFVEGTGATERRKNRTGGTVP